MSDEKALEKIGNKYLCMVSGQKLMTPCEGCSNPKGCLSRAMQYKENEEMDQQEEKAIVKVSADGDVVACAKGLEAKECGYKGGKVCGACGAMAVEAKASGEPLEKPNEAYSDEMNDVLEERMEEDDEKRREFIGAKSDDAEVEVKAEDEAEDAPAEDAPADETPAEETPADETPAEDEEVEEKSEGFMLKPSAEARRLALTSALGEKSDEIEDMDDAYLCQFDRKAYPNSREVCANCPGGCAAEDNMPGIADVEGMALSMFGGKVLASGYTGDGEYGDLFIVDILGKDGNAFEIIADGSTGEMLNFHRLNMKDLENSISGKSLEDGEMQPNFIDIKAAQDVAMGVIESEIDTKGEVVQADTDIFEGYDSYVFEIDAVNGKSYDVYVALDGSVLGYDEYDATEAEDIEAEAAELALKRAYSDDTREEMAKEGMAMEDGSYPIKDEADLRNAIQAYGRAKDKDATKAHIIKRAMDLGLEELIPENWVPKKVQEEAADEEGKDGDQARLMKDLLEFQMMAAEEDFKDYI